MDLISVNVTVDQIQQAYKLLLRRNPDTEKLTEVTVIGNQKEIPASNGSARYETLSLDQFFGEKITEWDGHSPMTLYFNSDGVFDHAAPTVAANATA